MYKGIIIIPDIFSIVFIAASASVVLWLQAQLSQLQEVHATELASMQVRVTHCGAQVANFAASVG
jgi:hypothetical protein